jgi:mono/diheme cytochrome c family protein
LLALCLLPACQQQMAKQPKYLPYQESKFFPDHRSARPPVPGTVARGQLRDDSHLFAGRKARGAANRQAARAAGVIGAGDAVAAAGLAPADLEKVQPDYVTEFPFPVTEEVMRRGQERFDIYCAMCHDYRGTGNGKIVQRGYSRPPSLTAPVRVDGEWRYDLSRGYRIRGIDLPVREAPVGYYFEVITNGMGAMPDYAAQIRPRDRWAIIAYVRALQQTQGVFLKDLPADERNAVREGIEREHHR